jgi:hypothetical protein
MQDQRSWAQLVRKTRLTLEVLHSFYLESIAERALRRLSGIPLGVRNEMSPGLECSCLGLLPARMLSASLDGRSAGGLWMSG